MAEETSPRGSSDLPSGTTPGQRPPAYGWLRWSIRITGILLMLGGTIYLAMLASELLTDKKTGSGLFVVVVSVAMLGLGIYVLRVGLNMLRSIDAHTIGSFSFVFALVYTWILAHVFPFWGLFNDWLGYVLPFLCFGLSYWLLKRILLHLLLPGEER